MVRLIHVVSSILVGVTIALLWSRWVLYLQHTIPDGGPGSFHRGLMNMPVIRVAIGMGALSAILAYWAIRAFGKRG